VWARESSVYEYRESSVYEYTHGSECGQLNEREQAASITITTELGPVWT